jgi:hypothetical protein
VREGVLRKIVDMPVGRRGRYRRLEAQPPSCVGSRSAAAEVEPCFSEWM